MTDTIIPMLSSLDRPYSVEDRNAIVSNIRLLHPDIFILDSHSGQLHLFLQLVKKRPKLIDNLISYSTYSNTRGINTLKIGFRNDLELKRLLSAEITKYNKPFSTCVSYKLFFLEYNNLKQKLRIEYQSDVIHYFKSKFVNNTLTEFDFEWYNLIYKEHVQVFPDDKFYSSKD